MTTDPKKLEAVLNRLKQDPQFELKQEFGKMLMMNINDFTPAQRKRYNELKAILIPKS